MTLPMTATPAQPAAMTSPTRAVLMPPMARIETRARACHFAETLAADFGAVARLARRLKGGSCDRIVGGLRSDRLGLGDGVDRHADKLSRTHPGRVLRRHRFRMANGRHDAGHFAQAAPSCSISRAPYLRATETSVRAKTDLLVLGKIFFAQAYPTAAAAQCRGDDFRQRASRLGPGRSPTAAVGSGSRIVVLCLAPCRPTAIMGNLCAQMSCLRNGGYGVARRSTARIVLAGALIFRARLGIALSGDGSKAQKARNGACAQSSGRCVADCDQLHWCQVYTCAGGKSTAVSFWRCFEPSGLCLAPHC